MSSSAIKYRSDIDGLRALAVLSVVFFHGGSKLFSGGFVGVDIFFVISGFLITSIIFKEVQTGNFSYRKFWLKRIRRIFPASMVSVFGAVLLFWFLLAPSGFVVFGKSLLSLGLFSSNIFFWRESGYFSPNAEEFPLLHTWSLAVEEQFYFFLPLLFPFLFSKGRRVLFWGLILSLIVSFGLSIWLTERSPAAAFYLLPTRAWELGLGSLLALVLNKEREEIGVLPFHLLSFLSVALMFAPIFLFNKKTPFPGANAAIPVFGALLFIWLPNKEKGLKYLFSRSPILYIGKISYSFYLWHWIIFTALKHSLIHYPEPFQFVLAGLVSFAISALSYHFIEQPVRLNHKFWDNRKLWGMLFSSIILFVGLGASAIYTKGFPNRLGESFVDYRGNSLLFDSKKICLKKNDGICNPGNSSGHFVWGDSHAIANMGAFKIMTPDNISFAIMNGCPPLLKVYLSGRSKTWNKDCQAHNRRVVNHLKNFSGKIHIIFRYDNYLNMRKKYESSFMEERYLYDPKGPGVKVFTKKTSFINLKRSLKNTMDALSGKDVVIWRQVPPFSIHPANFANKAQILNFDLTWMEEEERLSLRTSSFRKFVSENNWEFKDTWGPFCHEGQCSPFTVDSSGRTLSLYYDDDHLSEGGAELIDLN